MKALTSGRKFRGKKMTGYLFLLPWLVGFFGLTAFPMVASLFYSLCDYDMLTSPRFIGLKNYMDLFSDPKFKISLMVTIKYVFISVPLQLAFALFIAVLLKRDRKGIKIYRAVFYLPSLFGGSVAVSILWEQIFNKEGLFN